MHTEQHTIKELVSFSGIGVHTGLLTTLRLLPAPPDHGIQFRRIDIADSPHIAATTDQVVATHRCTVLGHNDVHISTVEHILAALSGLAIDNVLLELDGPEVPFLDGSSLPFVTALNQVGPVAQHIPRSYFTIPETILAEIEDTWFQAFPIQAYALTVLLSYDAPTLQHQYATLASSHHFATEIAAARTFAFVHELEALCQQGLIQGGSLANAVVLVDKPIEEQELTRLARLFHQPAMHVTAQGTLNNKLRYANEPARHKLLDLMGDLVLVGKPIQGHIMAYKPGHSANVAFAKKLRKIMLKQEKKTNLYAMDVQQAPILDSRDLRRLLPHRYPFQLVDKIIHLDQESITGVKNVTINEPFFPGHFPNYPVMPGVLQIEAITQTGGAFLLHTMPDPENYIPYFLGIDACRFRKQVLPGDTLLMRCQLVGNVKFTSNPPGKIAKMQGQAFVNNQLVCEAILLAQIVKQLV